MFVMKKVEGDKKQNLFVLTVQAHCERVGGGGSSKRLVFLAKKGALFEIFVMKKGRGRQETIVVC